MSKPEWGTKRICPNCGTRYYDMQRDPITCPKCGAPFDAESLVKTKKAARAVVPAAAQEEVVPLEDEELEADLAAEPDEEGEAITEIPAGEEGESREEESEPAVAGKGPSRGKVVEDEEKKDEEEEDEEVIEDASELGEDEDDMAEVIENVDEEDDR